MNISKVGFSGHYCIKANDEQQAGRLSRLANVYNNSNYGVTAFSEQNKVYVATRDSQFSSNDRTMLKNVLEQAGMDKSLVTDAYKKHSEKSGFIGEA